MNTFLGACVSLTEADVDEALIAAERHWLAPHFAPAHVANIRALARGGYWNGLAILRVQDNFVSQWGDPDAEDAATTLRTPVSAAASTTS